MKKIQPYFLILLKSLLVLLIGAGLFSNWWFIAGFVLQDAMMGSGLVAISISGMVIFLLSNKIFDFKKKWILSIILTILSFFLGIVIENNNLTYRDSHFHLKILEEKQRKWEEMELKRSKVEEARVAIETGIYEGYIINLIRYLESQNKYKFVTASQVSQEYILIYPKNLETVICPIRVKPLHKNEYIRYFVLLKNTKGSYEIYEWHYLDPRDFTNTAIGPSLMEQMNTVIDWNFSSRQINDDEFWKKKVRALENGQYKYLKEIEIQEKLAPTAP